MRYYPIIIFCYNRPHYLEKLLKSLKETKDFQKHRCYVFCDGPKNKNDKLQISSISKILSKFNFNKKDIIFRKKILFLGFKHIFNHFCLNVFKSDAHNFIQ
jgi:glycosyltransferase involved in cell wall biosynthesis